MSGLGPAGLINAQGVNTDFVEVGRTLFGAPDAFGPWRTWAGELPMDGLNLMGFMIGATGAVAEITGDRLWQSFRAYARTVPAKKYGPPGIEIEAIQVNNDKSGAVRNRLTGYLASAKDGFGKPANDFYVTNPTCIDGQALINGSHPFDSGGSTWTNDSSTTLSAAEQSVIILAMRGRLDEHGVNLGINPTHLMCSSSLEQVALDITGADRVVGITTAGNPALSGLTIGGAAMPNWAVQRGKLDVIVNPYMTAGTYAYMDLSRPDVRPIYFGIAKPFEAHVVDDPQSEPMKERSSYAYYAEGYAAFLGGIPQCIYGKDT
jgi:hypothetical protein